MAASRIVVRLARPGDVRSIASVLRRAFAEYESSYTPEAFAATTPGPDEIQRRIDQGPVWVATLSGDIVGTVSALQRATDLHIRSMAAVPSARGSGIGGLLLREIERFAFLHGCRRLTLCTTPFLARAIALYRSFGFERADEGPEDIHGTPLLTMTKRLNDGFRLN